MLTVWTNLKLCRLVKSQGLLEQTLFEEMRVSSANFRLTLQSTVIPIERKQLFTAT